MRKKTKKPNVAPRREEDLRHVKEIDCNVEDNGTSASCEIENSNGVITEVKDVGTLEMFDVEEAISDLDDLGTILYGGLDHRCKLNYYDSIITCHER